MKKKNIFWGLLFVLVAIILIVNKLGCFGGINVFSLIAAIFLIAIILKSIPHADFGGILFPLAFIAILFDDELGITAITPWIVLLAALFGTIGLSLIFHKNHFYVHFNDGKDVELYGGEEDIMTEDEGHIKVRNSFGSTIRYINSKSFERAAVSSSFGNVKLYLDNALLKDGKASINFDLSFGGAEIYVPKTWTVVKKVSTSFGGVSEKNLNNSNGENILTLLGSVSFAGVTIIYV